MGYLIAGRGLSMRCGPGGTGRFEANRVPMPSPSLTARSPRSGPSLLRRGLRVRGPGRGVVIAVLVLVLLLAGTYVVLRATPLSAVERVTIVGVSGPEASQIRRSLKTAAVGQSTLGFDADALRRAVRSSASITGVTAQARFPHTVQVEVEQLVGVGAIQAGGKRTAVAADGTLLSDWSAGQLPVIQAGRTHQGKLVGGSQTAAQILGAAPPELLNRVARVEGAATVRLVDGPALLFHDDHRLHARWAAAVAVLSDPKTAGVTWIDLRVPEQPVAGSGAPPTLPKHDAQVGKIDTTSDALATAEGEQSTGTTPVPPQDVP